MQPDEAMAFFRAKSVTEYPFVTKVENSTGGTVDKVRWLKHRLNGNVFQYTDVLAGHPDMIECDKNGKVMDLSPRVIETVEVVTTHSGQAVREVVRTKVIAPKADISDKPLAELIAECKTAEELGEIAARFDVGFAAGLSLDEMKAGFIEQIPAIEEKRAAEGAAKAEAHREKIEAEKKEAAKAKRKARAKAKKPSNDEPEEHAP
jgi:hypothetical protein